MYASIVFVHCTKQSSNSAPADRPGGGGGHNRRSGMLPAPRAGPRHHPGGGELAWGWGQHGLQLGGCCPPPGWLRNKQRMNGGPVWGAGRRGLQLRERCPSPGPESAITSGRATGRSGGRSGANFNSESAARPPGRPQKRKKKKRA